MKKYGIEEIKHSKIAVRLKNKSESNALLKEFRKARTDTKYSETLLVRREIKRKKICACIWVGGVYYADKFFFEEEEFEIISIHQIIELEDFKEDKMKKYTIEDFKNKEIAVWVGDKKEYEVFCKFAKGLCWRSKHSVKDFIPNFPTEIAFDWRSDERVTFIPAKGSHGQREDGYKSVTIEQLQFKNNQVANEE